MKAKEMSLSEAVGSMDNILVRFKRQSKKPSLLSKESSLLILTTTKPTPSDYPSAMIITTHMTRKCNALRSSCLVLAIMNRTSKIIETKPTWMSSHNKI